MRLLVFLLAAWAAWLILRGLARRLLGPSEPPVAPEGGEELVQDPVCGMFVSRREAVRMREGGRTYYFCGKGCRDAFLAKGRDGSSRDSRSSRS